MIGQGDLDLNSVHDSSDLLKETLKQTMLNQELVFRRQIFDLHQLYKVQRAMADDFKQKGLSYYNLHKGALSSIPINRHDQIKCSMAEFVQSENLNLDYGLQQQHPVFMQKPLDLQLSADEFINQCVDELSGNGLVTSCLKKSNLSNSFSQNEVDFGMDYPNLSLGIGRHANKMDREHKSWKGKNIIDLEDASLSFPNYEANLGLPSSSSAPNDCSSNKQKLDNFVDRGKQKLESFPQIGIPDGSYRNTPSKSLVDAGPSCQTQSRCDSGLYGHHRNSFLAKLLSENQKSTACKVNNFDLNTVQLEDPSHFSNDHSVVVNSSITSSSPVLEKVCPKSNVASSVSPASWRAFTEIHGIHQQKDVNSGDNGREKCIEDDNGAKISFVDLDSDSSEELDSSRSDPKISSVGSSSKISNGVSCDMDIVDTVRVEANSDKGLEEPFEQPKYCKLFSSSESECMVDHHSSSLKTMLSGVEFDDINFSTSDIREKNNTDPLVTHSGEDLRSSDSTESNAKCISKKEPDKVDERVQTAAELLLQISMEAQASCQGEVSKIPLEKLPSEENELQNKEENQPQCSLDSYEAMVLKLEECSPDEYCASSNAFVVDDSEKKDVKYKLKRGTRMRDFQKDILPSLSTLSRSEIREDVNIMEGVIRSREYKRMRGKMADGEGDVCRSTRRKRSRANRRYYI